MSTPLTCVRNALLSLALLITANIARSDEAPMIVHMLGYVGVDYPMTVVNGQVQDAAEFAEQQEFAARIVTLIETLPEQPGKSGLLADAKTLSADIAARAPGDQVSARTRAMRDAILGEYQVVLAPRTAPDPARGAALYNQNCASCHGIDGLGNGMAATGMQPAPTNFHDRARASQRSVYALYNTITLGVDGTAMTAFGQLPDDDRWALAFHVSRLAADDAERARGESAWPSFQSKGAFPDLAAVTRLSPSEAATQYGADGPVLLAFLRSDPKAVTGIGETPIAISRRLLGESVVHYTNGEAERAYATSVAAYLEGFELAENSLSAVDPNLKRTIEERMLAFRSLLKKGADVDTVRSTADAIGLLLTQADQRLRVTTLSPAAAFSSSAIIILREGLEAVLLLAVIVAFLRKTGRNDVVKYVHFGWIGALAMGGVTWWVASHVISISGASRELTEGVTALIAAAVLLYVGFWLHSKLHAARWREFIEERLGAALSGGAVATISGVAFIAVYREVFETVLFYQALWVQAGDSAQQMVLYGFLVASGLLLALTWVIFRASVRLPLRAFFAINSVLLYLLAVVFTGKGIAALQEAGVLTVTPLHFPRVDLLGIYPNAQSLGLQALLLIAAALFVWYSRRTASSTAH